jgi:hypothetical protein
MISSKKIAGLGRAYSAWPGLAGNPGLRSLCSLSPGCNRPGFQPYEDASFAKAPKGWAGIGAPILG